MSAPPDKIAAEHIACLAAMLDTPLRYTQRCVEQLSFLPDGGQRWVRTLQIRIPESPSSEREQKRKKRSKKSENHSSTPTWHAVSRGAEGGAQTRTERRWARLAEVVWEAAGEVISRAESS
ncbi:MAG: hypothetical protein WA843_04065 [Candidatus Saccharimonadales bacterium]